MFVNFARILSLILYLNVKIKDKIYYSTTSKIFFGFQTGSRLEISPQGWLKISCGCLYLEKFPLDFLTLTYIQKVQSEIENLDCDIENAIDATKYPISLNDSRLASVRATTEPVNLTWLTQIVVHANWEV